MLPPRRRCAPWCAVARSFFAECPTVTVLRTYYRGFYRLAYGRVTENNGTQGDGKDDIRQCNVYEQTFLISHYVPVNAAMRGVTSREQIWKTCPVEFSLILH